ncbi:GNAT family N-acetyltransferase [Marinobacter sp. 1Y8]
MSKLGAPHYSAREIEIWQTWAHNISTVASTLKEGETLVAYYNGVIAGFAQRSPSNLINMLYTHPDYARQGIATALLRILIDHANNEGVPELSANASRVSRAAFEQHGFFCNGEEWIERREVRIQRFLMVRRARDTQKAKSPVI